MRIDILTVVPELLTSPLLLRTVQDRLVEGRGQQFGYDGEDVNAHV